MRTTLHVYSFDTSKPDDAAAYEALRARLLATPGRGHCMNAFGDYDGEARDIAGPVELDPKHLFENQWNTAAGEGSKNGRRVFDWAETARSADVHRMNNPGRSVAPLHIRRGHYLDITDEMRAIRRDTLTCGYCGAQHPAATAPTFCDKCLDSEYLKESDLLLLRLRPVDTAFDAKRPPLSETEAAALLPAYVKAQTHGSTERGKARIAAKRAAVLAKYDATTRNATTERDGFLWIMDHGLNPDNVIFYSHTGRFCWGWRGDRGIGDDVTDRLLEYISEFPFPYDIKTDPSGKHSGRTLSGE